MRRLGYDRYVAQGGDWGNAVTEQMALLTPAGLIGIHTNMPATVPDAIQAALTNGDAPPADLSAEERGAWDQLAFFYAHGLGVRAGDGRTGRRRCTRSRTPRSASPRGCSTTTRAATT